METDPAPITLSLLEAAAAYLAERDQFAAIADGIRAWCSHESDGPLDVALGIGGDWPRRQRERRRNELLRDLARLPPFTGLTGKPLARAIERAIRRYETDAYPRHRRSGKPEGEQGILFDIVSLGPTVGRSRIVQIFNNLRG